MKKIVSIILPSLLISVLIFVLIFILIDSKIPNNKPMVSGIILFFPIIFIIQGIIYSNLNSKKNLIIGFLLSSTAIIVPTSIWYNMGSVIIPVRNYLLLGVIAFFLSNKIKNIKDNRVGAK